MGDREFCRVLPGGQEREADFPQLPWALKMWPTGTVPTKSNGRNGKNFLRGRLGELWGWNFRLWKKRSLRRSHLWPWEAGSIVAGAGVGAPEAQWLGGSRRSPKKALDVL